MTDIAYKENGITWPQRQRVIRQQAKLRSFVHDFGGHKPTDNNRKRTTVSVLVDVDEGIASLVESLQKIDGVRTHASRGEATYDNKGNLLRDKYVLVSWDNDYALRVLSHDFHLSVEGDHWGYVYVK